MAALRAINMSRMTDDFHFDTEIIIKLQHQGVSIKEIPIPTYYGDEICHVNGLGYALNVVKSVKRYHATVDSVKRHPEFEEYFTHYPLKKGEDSSHRALQKMIGTDRDVLDIGCGEVFSRAHCGATEIGWSASTFSNNRRWRLVSIATSRRISMADLGLQVGRCVACASIGSCCWTCSSICDTPPSC